MAQLTLLDELVNALAAAGEGAVIEEYLGQAFSDYGQGGDKDRMLWSGNEVLEKALMLSDDIREMIEYDPELAPVKNYRVGV